MKLIITPHNLGLWAASYIVKNFLAVPTYPFTLGLPTGSTVEEMYAALCSLAQHKKINFKQIHTFNMDEYVGLSAEHPQSYAYYMCQHLFDHIDIPQENIHLLDGLTTDVQKTCQQYEEAISQQGGIDLFLGGVGRNGHLAFNEPGSTLDSRTRMISLTDSTRQANARFFNHDPALVPPHALTVGIGTILEAKELLFLASGPAKASAVARLAQGDITPQWPITALHAHHHAMLLIDPTAAEELPQALQADWQRHNRRQPDQDFYINL